MLDLVVYGATGFTGRLVAAYLRRSAPSGLRWALAGRDAARLEAVAAEIEAQPGLAAGVGAAPVSVLGGCDADEASAARIAGETRAVLSTAGPFSKYSDALVGACAAGGVSYVDINGEIPWVARVIERHDEAARASGALIVPNCGFDSVPSDLCALRATRLLADGTGSACVSVQGVMHMTGAMSGGTIETGLEMETLASGLSSLPPPSLLDGPASGVHRSGSTRASCGSPSGSEAPRGSRAAARARARRGSNFTP